MFCYIFCVVSRVIYLLVIKRFLVNFRADRDSLKAAQRLAHRHPYSTQSWSLLGGSAYAKAVLSK